MYYLWGRIFAFFSYQEELSFTLVSLFSNTFVDLGFKATIVQISLVSVMFYLA